MITQEELINSLAIKDLSDDKNGIHAINIIMNAIKDKITCIYNKTPVIIRNSPIVSVKNNYDNLYYPQDTITKSNRYTRWIDDKSILRTQVTSGIIDILKKHVDEDVIYMLPGLVYRRDVIDKTHVGEPHQMDIWRVSCLKKYTREDLLMLVQTILDAILPNCEWRYNETSHYYTKDGIEVEVLVNNKWLEVLECGLILPKLLDDNGLDSNIWSGLALGLGLDRSVMIKKQIPDIRLLRHSDVRIAEQMLNLELYKEVSNYPIIKRDISIAVSKDMDVELLGDEVRTLINNSEWIEEVEIKSETNYESLPSHVSERLGMDSSMKNILIGMKLRALDKTITNIEANSIIEDLYKKIHRGIKGYI